MKLGPEDIRLFRLRRSCAKDTDLVYWRQQRCIRRPSIRPEEDFQSVDIGHAQAGGHPWRCRSNYPRLLLLFLLLVSWTAPPAWDLKWALWLVSPIRRCDVVCFIIYALIARYVNKVLNNKMQQIGTNLGHADRMLRFSILKLAPKNSNAPDWPQVNDWLNLQRIVLKVHDIRSSVFRFIRVDQFGAGFDFPIH